MFRSDLIPHKDFHKGYWFKSQLSNWYYFREEKRSFIVKKGFNYNSLDEQLVHLVRKLHKNGHKTTPSCAGHFFTEEYFKEVYKKIKIEEYIINNLGLELYNIETKQKEIFKDRGYSFPYTEESFIHEAIPYSKKGVLGILGDFSYIVNTKNYTVEYKDGITFFFTENGSQKVWNQIRSEINLDSAVPLI